MSKTFDRVEWDFLRQMMIRLGFHSKWVELVMLCVSSVRYNVVLNGHEIGPIFPQILRARYFPHGNFLDARLGANPSYAWRSIMAYQDLIRTRARKRIGSGYQTKIWGDPWLPDLINPCIESQCYPELQLATVSSLHSATTGTWDVDLIKEYFNERDQQLILSIPLSN